ncbi:MAG: 30S ribosomal protein THX [Candidatus Omnitrophota bacterium]|jgi:30S ribosomal protein S31
MGKGDKKTKRGKIVAGTHGKTRSRKKEKQRKTKNPVAKKA